MRQRPFFHFLVVFLMTSIILLTIAISMVYGQDAFVDDCEHSGSQNMFESHWFVYDDIEKSVDYNGQYDPAIDFFNDSLDPGNSSITNFKKLTALDYEEFSSTPDSGNPNGSVGHGAAISFQFGNKKPHFGPKDKDTFGCFVGIGTELISHGNCIDLTGASHISYWAKASDTIQVNFTVATMQGRFSFFTSYYQVLHTITPEWKQFFVYLREKNSYNPKDSMYLAQPEWVIDEKPKHPADKKCLAILPFDISRVTMLKWGLEGAGEADHKNVGWDKKSGSLIVDDIVVHNYSWYPEDVSFDCDTISGIGANIGENSLNLTSGGWDDILKDGSWYAFNDASMRNVSIPVTEFSWIDTAMAQYGAPDTNKPELMLLDATGVSGMEGDTAAYISYILGPSYKSINAMDSTDTSDVDPFVGIGLSFCHELAKFEKFDADSANVNSLFFDYKTEGNAEFVTVAILTRQKLIENGAKFYLKLPSTGGIWKGANIRFYKFDLPPWDDKDTAVFDPKQITTIQWAIEGDSGVTGKLSIDNVYLYYDATGIKTLKNNKVIKNGSFLKILKNKLIYTLPIGVKFAQAELFDLHGRTLVSDKVKITTTKRYELSVTTNDLASGTYLFRLVANGSQLNTVFTQVVTILK